VLILAVATAVTWAGQFAPDHFIVQFRTDISIEQRDGTVLTGLAEVDALNRTWNITSAAPVFRGPVNPLARRLGLNRVFVLGTSSPIDIIQAVAEYGRLASVAYAEPDYLGQAYTTPNDPSYPNQWGLKNTGQNPGGDHPGIPGCDIDAERAWDIERGSRDIIIGHLDTGVDLDHPDFVSYYQASVIWRNWDEIPRNNIDDDGNGYVDDTLGWNFVANNNNPQDNSVDDRGNPLGHGTHTAGIAAAHANNSRGVAGTAWYCQVMPLKVLNQNGWGYYSWWASAIYYAVAKGARIINMSLGGTDTSTTLRNAVDFAWNSGVVVVASMGNDNNNVPHYPAAYDNTIAVGMTDNDDDRVVPNHNGSGSYGSCYGPWIDLMAPGNWIYSTGWNDTYRYMVGTSMAAPFVTGTAALLLSRNPDLTNNQVRNILCSTAEDHGAPGYDTFYGFGRINAYQALQQVQFLPGWTAETLLATSAQGCEEADIGLSGQNVHIIYTDKNAARPGLYYIRSTDGGRTFAPPRQLTAYQHNWSSFYPHIAVSGNRLWVVFQDTRGTNCGIYFKTSTDNGQTWSSDALVSNSTVVSYHPDVCGSGDTIHIVWDTGYRRSTNGGSSWDAINTSVTGQAIACSGNKVYVVKTENISGTYQVKLLRYNGTSWDPAVQLSNASGPAYLNPDVAAAGQCVSVAWDQDMDNDGTTEAIICRRSTNQGGNWQSPQRLAIVGDNYTFRNPRLAAGPAGVDLVWWGDRDRYWSCDIYYRHSSDSGANWGHTYRLCNNGYNDFDELPAVAVQADTVQVVWDRMANGTKSVYYIRKGLTSTRHDVAARRIIAPSGTIPAGTVVTPQAQVRNLGSTTESFSVRFRIGTVYSHDTVVTALAAGDSATVTFTPWTAVSGNYALSCSTLLANDADPANDRTTGSVVVSTAGAGWTAKAELPASPSGRPAQDGAWLAIFRAGGTIYAAKGNKTGDFYSYNITSNTWTQLPSWPTGREGKLGHKGAVGVADGAGNVYATKGANTLGFWCYYQNTGSWIQLPDVPLGPNGKKVKGGTDLVYVVRNDTGFLYLLKGYKNEFYRLNTVASRWDTLPPAPVGANPKWDKGSWLVFDGTGALYAHKAKYHELWRFDLGTGTWSSAPLPGMPFIGSMGKYKKSKDGGCAAYANGAIYALKGGNTQEFWQYTIATNSWSELDTMPSVGTSGNKKRVKAGGDIVADSDGRLFALKGNKTNEFWCYGGWDIKAQPSEPAGPATSGSVSKPSISLGQNPIRGWARLNLVLPGSEKVSLRLFDRTGRRVLEKHLAVHPHSSEALLDCRGLAAGIYLLDVKAGSTRKTFKLVTAP